MPNEIVARIQQLGIIPVIVIDQAESASDLGEALIKGGLPCAEITFRTDAAAEAIQRLSRERPEILLGAGTVLSEDQARKAHDSGAQFIVSPGLNMRIVDFCRDRGIDVFPGVCTPTEIDAARNRGLKVVKFFPAEPIGGLTYLKAIAAPYGDVSYIPTGGIGLTQLPEYLGFPKVLACGGSWLVRKDWLAAGQFDRVTQAAAEAVRLVKETREATE